MSDDWELAHGLSPLDPFDVLADADGDGDSNWHEFMQGTDPLDAASNSRQDEIPRAPREAQVFRRDDGSWTVSWLDVSDNETRFVVYERLASNTRVQLG